MLVWEYDQEAEFKAIRADGIEQGTTLELISRNTGFPIDVAKSYSNCK